MATTGDPIQAIALDIITTTAIPTTTNEETLIDPKSVAPDMEPAAVSTDQDRRVVVQEAGKDVVDTIQRLLLSKEH